MEVSSIVDAVEETPFELSERARDIQARSRRFVEDVLIPLEEEAERAHGRLPQEAIDRVKAEAVEAGDREAIVEELEAVEPLREWLALDRFDRRAANRRLRLYAAGDARWREEP